MDLVLLSTYNAKQIIAAVVLSVIYLGEKFEWKWDLPGILIIIGGTTWMILVADKEPNSPTYS